MVILGLVFTFASKSWANDFSYTDGLRKGKIALDGGFGFTLSPDTFLMKFGADYFVTHHFGIGPVLQIGLDDNLFIMAPTLGVKGFADLSGNTYAFLRRVKPLVQGGVGLAYVDIDGFDDDVGFLMNFGFGVDVFVTQNLSLGNNMLFNIIPTKVFNDRFYFSWEFISFRYRF